MCSSGHYNADINEARKAAAEYIHRKNTWLTVGSHLQSAV